MALEKYSIELKLDAGPEGHEAMTELLKTYAFQMLSGAMLLSPDKKPMIVCRVADSFYDEREIELFNENGDG